MAFVLKRRPTFAWTVNYAEPSAPDTYERWTFVATFRVIPQSRIDEIYATRGQEGLEASKLCEELLVGWEGITDENGNPVPFNEVTRAELLDRRGMRAAILQAWSEALQGAARKN